MSERKRTLPPDGWHLNSDDAFGEPTTPAASPPGGERAALGRALACASELSTAALDELRVRVEQWLSERRSRDSRMADDAAGESGAGKDGKP